MNWWMLLAYAVGGSVIGIGGFIIGFWTGLKSMSKVMVQHPRKFQDILDKVMKND